MKKNLLFPLLFLALPSAYAQCGVAALPYAVNAEAATPPALPECMTSNWDSFASNEVFKTIPGPVAGYTGNVLGYNTTVNTDFGTDPSSPVSASLYTQSFELQQGDYYSLSYRYGNSGASQNINDVYVSLVSGGISNTEIVHHENITGAIPTNYSSQPFTVATTGIYTVVFNVYSTGTQGFFYLDDIVFKKEQGAMGIEDNTLADIMAFPNPVKDVVTLTGGERLTRAVLFAATGQQVLTQAINSSAASIDMGKLAAGIYVLHVEAGNKRRILKLVKQ